MGRKRRVAIGLGTAAAALAFAQRSARASGRDSRVDVEDLAARGERAWAGVRDAFAAGRERLVEVSRKRGPAVASAVRRGTGRVAEGIVELREHLPAGLPAVPLIRREERSMFDRVVNRFTLGFGVGYVLGARAGRERYEQLVRWWERFAGSPVVQQATEQGRTLLGEAQDKISGQIRERTGSRQAKHIRDVMTPLPVTVKTSDTVAAAANNMRQIDVGSMIVVDESGRVVGIVTDRDIAIRAVAQGRDPQATAVGEISSEALTTLSPSDSVDDAVRVMRDKAIRRLPVVEDDRPVGIVSIGDLAAARDPRSALADISIEPPNR